MQVILQHLRKEGFHYNLEIRKYCLLGESETFPFSLPLFLGIDWKGNKEDLPLLFWDIVECLVRENVIEETSSITEVYMQNIRSPKNTLGLILQPCKKLII